MSACGLSRFRLGAYARGKPTRTYGGSKLAAINCNIGCPWPEIDLCPKNQSSWEITAELGQGVVGKTMRAAVTLSRVIVPPCHSGAHFHWGAISAPWQEAWYL